jgi:succinate-semialdehyde dehydrogenase/glutarate-semialdehyde dehydrogenase
MSPTLPEQAAAARPAASLPPTLTAELVERLTRRVVAGQDATRLTTYAPYTGGVLAELPQSSEDDVVEAYQVARLAQRQWARTPVRERAKIFLRYHDLVLKRQDEVMDLIQAENGKARRDAFLEAADIAITARYYARKAPGLLRPQGRTGLIPGLTSATELRHPKGVVGIISPWNYPFSLAAGDTIPALLAGNAVVQKPDNQTALTALWGVELMYEAGLPEGLWQIVLGSGRTIGTPLMDNANYMMFTGSTNTGRHIAKTAGERLIGASLELGGKNAMLVLDDADLNRTVEGAVRACFASTGQLCISMERMYVQGGIYDTFVPRFAERVKAMQLGTTYDYSYEVGSLTSKEQLAAVTAHVEDAVSKGATVLAGGRPRPEVGPFFFEPTVLADVTSEMACHGDETFGPVVSIYRFSDVEDAIAKANGTPYGLNASVWTGDGRRGRDIGARLHAGTVNVNEAFVPAWGSVDAPMGGMGDSGLGRRHGSEGLLKYTEAQTVALQRLRNIGPIGDMSYDTYAKGMTMALKALKTIGWK